MWPTKSVQMKEKTKKKQHSCKNVIDGRKHFIRCIQKTSENDFNKLQVNNFGHNEGTGYLVSKQVNGCQGDGFSTVGVQIGTIKLTMAGT